MTQESLPLPSEGESTVELFQKKGIRRVFHNNEWWYVVVDVIARLTDSVDPNGYLTDMRRRDKGFGEAWWQIATPLEIQTTRGKERWIAPAIST